MSDINERIKQLRKKKHLTLLEVAEFLGVKEATVQRYESGTIKNIKYDTILKLSELFDCDPTYLMGWCNETSGTIASTITAGAVVNGNNATTVIVHPGDDKIEVEATDQELELLRIFNSLGLKGKTRLLSYAYELEEGEAK